jgi:hypothetical protein
MKLRGGEWSKGDVLAFLGLLVAVVGVAAAILGIPGMPKLVHWDSESPVKQESQPAATPALPAKRVTKAADVTSGQVNFGCDQTLPVETPLVSFGKNPQDIAAKPTWANSDNVKTQNQSVSNVEDANHHVVGVKAFGSITGHDSQYVLGVKNCPGGGHGELTLHVTWTQDE